MYLFPTLLCIRGTADLKPNLPTLLCRDTTTHQFIQPWEGCWNASNGSRLAKWCLMLTRFETWVAPVFFRINPPRLETHGFASQIGSFSQKNRGLKIKKLWNHQPSWWLRLANISDWQNKNMSEMSISNNSCPKVWGIGLLLWVHVNLAGSWSLLRFSWGILHKESSQIFRLAHSNAKKSPRASPMFHHYCFMAEIWHKPMMGPHAYNLIYHQISAAFPSS